MKILKWLSLKLETLGYRLELIQECQRLAHAGRMIPGNYLQLCVRSPARYDDFINFLCFLDNKKAVNLIDIGANVGNFSRDFLIFYPNAKEIVCFEPSPHVAENIQSNVGDKRLNVINAALGSVNRKLTICYPKGNTVIASFHQYTDDVNSFYKTDERVTEEVQVYTLDDTCADFSQDDAFIVKIDTQGHEIEVIKGGLSVLSRASVAILECSFAPEYSNESVSTFSQASQILASIDLYPIIFQGYGKDISAYSFERDVVFVKSHLLSNIFYKNYSKY
jgi:FkbM family methyltransferase